MTKDEARIILEDWINDKTSDSHGEHRMMRLPIVDERVHSEVSIDGNGNTHISDWSFKGLIKIAYDLKDI